MTLSLPLTGRWLRYSLAVFGIAAVVAFGSERHADAAYCSWCGLKRETVGVRVCRLLPLDEVSYSDCAYTRLFRRYVEPRCHHQWRPASRCVSGLLGWPLSCEGKAPLPFDDAPASPFSNGVTGDQLPLLARLEDPDRVRKALRAVAYLMRPPARAYELRNAFEELREVRSPAEQNAWWRRRQKLIECR